MTILGLVIVAISVGLQRSALKADPAGLLHGTKTLANACTGGIAIGALLALLGVIF
jgi:hypothetical protein